MVSFIELARFEEALQDKEHWSEFGVLFEKLFDQFDAVDAVFAIEADVHVDTGLFVFELDNWNFSVFDGFNGGANVCSDKL